MEKKQSSIEWFIDKIEENTIGDIWENVSFSKVQISINVSDYLDLKEHAKAMHKEESELLFECGRNFQLTGEGTFNKVYNETFGGNNE